MCPREQMGTKGDGACDGTEDMGGGRRCGSAGKRVMVKVGQPGPRQPLHMGGTNRLKLRSCISVWKGCGSNISHPLSS